MYDFKTEQIKESLINWIRDWFWKNGKRCNAIIGISGGKDSSVVAALCVAALGKERVIGVMMPNGVQKDISDSIRVCEHLGIKNFTINIADSVNSIIKQMENSGIDVTEQTIVNLPARIRMSALYAVSQSHNGRVSNNCNLSENIVGYATIFGDAAGDFSPLANLTTIEVSKIGESLGLPKDLVYKTPIDGLNTHPDGSYVTDEDNMGLLYEDIHNFARDTGNLDPETRIKIIERRDKNKFKLEKMAEYSPKWNLLYTSENEEER